MVVPGGGQVRGLATVGKMSGDQRALKELGSGRNGDVPVQPGVRPDRSVARGQITDRLRWHAGLGGEPEHAASVSIAACTVGDGCSGDRVRAAVADVLAALGQLNREPNGLVPVCNARRLGRYSP
jgi:hypothetical protein